MVSSAFNDHISLALHRIIASCIYKMIVLVQAAVLLCASNGGCMQNTRSRREGGMRAGVLRMLHDAASSMLATQMAKFQFGLAYRHSNLDLNLHVIHQS